MCSLDTPSIPELLEEIKRGRDEIKSMLVRIEAKVGQMVESGAASRR